MNSRGLYEFGRRREIEPDDLRYAVELGARVRLEDDRQGDLAEPSGVLRRPGHPPEQRVGPDMLVAVTALLTHARRTAAPPQGRLTA